MKTLEEKVEALFTHLTNGESSIQLSRDTDRTLYVNAGYRQACVAARLGRWGFHLLNERGQYWGVPWATGGFGAA